MFMSSTYVYYREVTLEDDTLNITTVDENVSENAKKILMENNDDDGTNHLSSSYQYEKPNVREGLMKSKSLNSLNYDGDTDSLYAEDEAIKYEDIKLKCSICDIEYNAYLELPSKIVKDIADGQALRKKVKRKKKKEENGTYNDEEEDDDYRKINFEEYKDWAHRMEEFDPKAERKWTLEYQVNDELPRLSKIIIGRGHENEFPELNNIHLFDDVKGYEKSQWRNDILSSLQKSNTSIKSAFSMIPSNETCLFCFAERQCNLKQMQIDGKSFISHPFCSVSEEIHESFPVKSSTPMKHNDNIQNGNQRNRAITIHNDNRKSSEIRMPNDKSKLKNISFGKTITKIMRARKQQYQCEDKDEEDFEIL